MYFSFFSPSPEWNICGVCPILLFLLQDSNMSVTLSAATCNCYMAQMPGTIVSSFLSNKQWVNTITSNGKQCSFPLPIMIQAFEQYKKLNEFSDY